MANRIKKQKKQNKKPQAVTSKFKPCIVSTNTLAEAQEGFMNMLDMMGLLSIKHYSTHDTERGSRFIALLDENSVVKTELNGKSMWKHECCVFDESKSKTLRDFVHLGGTRLDVLNGGSAHSVLFYPSKNESCVNFLIEGHEYGGNQKGNITGYFNGNTTYITDVGGMNKMNATFVFVVLSLVISTTNLIEYGAARLSGKHFVLSNDVVFSPDHDRFIITKVFDITIPEGGIKKLVRFTNDHLFDAKLADVGLFEVSRDIDEGVATLTPSMSDKVLIDIPMLNDSYRFNIISNDNRIMAEDYKASVTFVKSKGEIIGLVKRSIGEAQISSVFLVTKENSVFFDCNSGMLRGINTGIDKDVDSQKKDPLTQVLMFMTADIVVASMILRVILHKGEELKELSVSSCPTNVIENGDLTKVSKLPAKEETENRRNSITLYLDDLIANKRKEVRKYLRSKDVTPHMRSGHLRHYKSGKVVEVKACSVKGGKRFTTTEVGITVGSNNI